jgi:hypothetical protein
MEDLDNNEFGFDKVEGIGMDREETPTPKKRKRVAKTPVTKAKLSKTDRVKMFYDRCGGNANKLAAQLGYDKAVVEQIIRDENL